MMADPSLLLTIVVVRPALRLLFPLGLFRRSSASSRASALGLALGGLGAVGQDLGDPDQGEFLAVAALAARILAPALLERDDLRAAALRQRPRPRPRRPRRSGCPSVTLSPPTTSTSPNWMISPGSPAIFSTFNLSSAATRYCLPPVLMTANIFPSCSFPALGIPARLLVQSVCLSGFGRSEAAETQSERARRARRARCL